MHVKRILYGVALWQPQAENVFVESTGVIPVNEKQHYEKAKEFLNVSKECDLVLTPEYSFSWELLDEILSSKIYYPKDGSLWCFCMQGIAVDDFEKRIKSYQSYMPKDFNIEFKEKNKYVNILIYLVNCQGNVFVLPQLKRHPEKHEESHMCFGDEILVFNVGNRNFFSYICADTNLSRENNSLIADEYENIIFHPQFNDNFFEENYCSRKKDALELYNNIYISLNWGRPTTVAVAKTSKEIGGYSSISCRSDESFNDFGKAFDFKKLINKNHCKGLFFLQEKFKKEFNYFLYIEDQILLADVEFFPNSEEGIQKCNLTVNAKKCLIFREEEDKYGLQNKCRIDLDSIMMPIIQKDVFSECECCRKLSPTLSCISNSESTEYERFFSICLSIFNEKEAFQHNNDEMNRVAYAYRDIKQCKNTRNLVKTLVDIVYDGAECDLGAVYAKWKTVALKFDKNEFANAEFASIDGVDKEKGIVAIANTENMEQLEKTFDRFLMMQKNKGDGKNLLLFYGEGAKIKVFDRGHHFTDLSKNNYSVQFSALNNFRK